MLGEDTSRLVGSLILAQTWQAVTTRARQPEHHRRDTALIIDEAHNFLHLPHAIDDMLAEARGYRVAITLAHQHLAQLPRDLRDGVIANARNKIYFSLSADDATHLARHTQPELGPHDLTHPDAFHATARLVHHGRDMPACTLALHRPPDHPDPPRSRASRDRPGPVAPGQARPGPRPAPARPRPPIPAAHRGPPRHNGRTRPCPGLRTSTHPTSAAPDLSDHRATPGSVRRRARSPIRQQKDGVSA